MELGENNRFKSATRKEVVINHESGEILDTNFALAKVSAQPNFVKLFLKDLYKLYELTGSEVKVMLTFISKMNYDNEVVLTGRIKEEMALVLKIEKNTFEHAIGTLVKKELIYKKGNNWYFVDPFIFGKGDDKNIQQLRLTGIYDEKGKKVEVEKIYQAAITFPPQERSM